MTTLALIDDDLALALLLKNYLTQHGFDLHTAPDEAKGLELIQRLNPRLVLLDVMIPQTDGFALLQKIRKTKRIPVMMLTARGETADRILGLELGADDYLTKPFEPRELVARIKAILKRSERASDEVILSGSLSVDPIKRLVTMDNQPLELTTSEYDLVLLFVQNPGRKFTRDELLSALRGQESESFGRAIDNLVARVRRKLGSSRIQTVWGTGYVYIEDSQK